MNTTPPSIEISTITCRWGFTLADGFQGKGCSSRSLIQKLKTSCVMHDASYTAVFQLSGSLDVILELLSKMGYAASASEIHLTSHDLN